MSETSYKPGATRSVSLTTTSAASAVIGAGQTGGKRVRVWSTVDCFINRDVAAVAGVPSMPLTASVPEYFDVPAGSYVSGIVGSGTGTLYITDMSK